MLCKADPSARELELRKSWRNLYKKAALRVKCNYFEINTSPRRKL